MRSDMSVVMTRYFNKDGIVFSLAITVPLKLPMSLDFPTFGREVAGTKPQHHGTTHRRD